MQLAIRDCKHATVSQTVSTGPYLARFTGEGSRYPIPNTTPRVTQYPVHGSVVRVASSPIKAKSQPDRLKLGGQFMQTSPRVVAEPKQNIEARIGGAFTEWMQGIGPISDTRKIVCHPAYKRIVSTGKKRVFLSFFVICSESRAS